MKSFHKNQIQRQARAVRKAASYIRNPRAGWSNQQAQERKEIIAKYKLTNGDGYDPLRAKQLVMTSSDSKAAMLFRAYRTCTFFDNGIAANFDFRCMALILLGKVVDLREPTRCFENRERFNQFLKNKGMVPTFL